MKKGSVTSIRTTLKNIAKRERIDFQIIVVRYLHERLLYRMAISAYVNRFILKGGALLYALEGIHIRPTRDIDILARHTTNDKEILKNIFREICSLQYDDDCVTFDNMRLTIWKAFLRKMKIFENPDFSHVVKSIIERLQPIYNELANGK